MKTKILAGPEEQTEHEDLWDMGQEWQMGFRLR